MKKTIASLESEIITISKDRAIFIERNKLLMDEDEVLRKEFAKAFNWFQGSRKWNDDGETPLTPTWEQIFVQIGKLLSDRKIVDLEEEMMNINNHLRILDNKVFPVKSSDQMTN